MKKKIIFRRKVAQTKNMSVCTTANAQKSSRKPQKIP